MAIGNSDFAVGGLAFLVHGRCPSGRALLALHRLRGGGYTMGPQISRRQRRQQNVSDRAQSTGVLTGTAFGDARATDCLATADAGSTAQQRLSRNASRLADSHKASRPWPSCRSCIEAWGAFGGVRTRPAPVK